MSEESKKLIDAFVLSLRRACEVAAMIMEVRFAKVDGMNVFRAESEGFVVYFEHEGRYVAVTIPYTAWDTKVIVGHLTTAIRGLKSGPDET